MSFCTTDCTIATSTSTTNYGSCPHSLREPSFESDENTSQTRQSNNKIAKIQPSQNTSSAKSPRRTFVWSGYYDHEVSLIYFGCPGVAQEIQQRRRCSEYLQYNLGKLLPTTLVCPGHFIYSSEVFLIYFIRQPTMEKRMELQNPPNGAGMNIILKGIPITVHTVYDILGVLYPYLAVPVTLQNYYQHLLQFRRILHILCPRLVHQVASSLSMRTNVLAIFDYHRSSNYGFSNVTSHNNGWGNGGQGSRCNDYALIQVERIIGEIVHFTFHRLQSSSFIYLTWSVCQSERRSEESHARLCWFQFDASIPLNNDVQQYFSDLTTTQGKIWDPEHFRKYRKLLPNPTSNQRQLRYITDSMSEKAVSDRLDYDNRTPPNKNSISKSHSIARHAMVPESFGGIAQSSVLYCIRNLDSRMLSSTAQASIAESRYHGPNLAIYRMPSKPLELPSTTIRERELQRMSSILHSNSDGNINSNDNYPRLYPRKKKKCGLIKSLRLLLDLHTYSTKESNVRFSRARENVSKRRFSERQVVTVEAPERFGVESNSGKRMDRYRRSDRQRTFDSKVGEIKSRTGWVQVPSTMEMWGIVSCEWICYTYAAEIGQFAYPLAITEDSDESARILLRPKGSKKKRLYVADTETGIIRHLGTGSYEEQIKLLISGDYARDTDFWMYRENIKEHFPMYSQIFEHANM